MNEIFSKIHSILSASDAAFLSFANNELFAKTIPAKLQSYMACGIPILASACGETKRVIEEAQCGLVSEIGKSEALANHILQFSSLTVENRNIMALNAVKYCNKYFEKTTLHDQILRELCLIDEDLIGVGNI